MRRNRKNRGRPKAKRLWPEEAPSLKKRILEVFPSLTAFYADAFKEAANAKYNGFPQPEDDVSVAGAFAAAFSRRRALPPLYWKVLEELLAIKQEDFPSQDVAEAARSETAKKPSAPDSSQGLATQVGGPVVTPTIPPPHQPVGDALPATAPESPVSAEEPIPRAIQELIDGADKLDAEGKYSEALVLIERALKAAEEAGHEMAIIKAKIDLAECITRTGAELDRAESLLKTCLDRLPPGRDDESRETVLIYLAHISTTQGRVHEAKSLAVEALESARVRTDRFTMGRALIEVGHAEEMLGNLQDALRVLSDAAQHFRAERRNAEAKTRCKAATNLAGCLMTQAMVLEHQGNAHDMLACLAEAEQILREGDSPDNLARTLLTKTRALFALSQFEQGAKALQEACEIFVRIGNFHWLLKCVEAKIRLARQFGKADEAMRFGSVAVTLAKEHGTPHDIAETLGRMAALCREHGWKEPAEKFLAEAKRVAGEHQLHDLLADCLLDQAGEGKAESDDQRHLLEIALQHLLSALTATQVRGRRGVLMERIATVHARLGNLPESRSWLEQALAIFDGIGDVGGSMQILGSLAALAREEGNPEFAIGLMESLIEKAKGKPFEHFRASAHHDLVHLRLAQGNIPAAQEHFRAARALCQSNHFPDVEKALQMTEERLEMAARYHKPAPSTLPEMLRRLRGWTDRFPEQADAIFPAWFYLFGAEAWSNCRSLLGVKFLVHASDRFAFESFAREWAECGDLFIYHPALSLRCERGIDVIPWDDDLLVPPTLKFAGFRKKQGGQSSAEENVSDEMDKDASAKAMVALLHEIPYYATIFSGPVPGLPAAKLYVVGRKHRLPQDVQDTLLAHPMESLIKNRIFVLPREEKERLDTPFAMTVAWEGGHLPVFFGAPPSSDELALEREVSVQLPANEHSKRALRRFMAEVASDAPLALTRLVEDLKATPNAAERLACGTLKIFRFRAGTRQVSHPALVL